MPVIILNLFSSFCSLPKISYIIRANPCYPVRNNFTVKSTLPDIILDKIHLLKFILFYQNKR